MELGVQTVHLRLLCLAFGDVGVRDHVADHAAGSVSHRGGRNRDVDERSILALTHGFVVVNRLARTHPCEELLALRALGRRRHREVAAAQHLLTRPAKDALGCWVPQPDAGIQAELHERERRGVDQRLQLLDLMLALRDLVVHGRSSIIASSMDGQRETAPFVDRASPRS